MVRKKALLSGLIVLIILVNCLTFNVLAQNKMRFVVLNDGKYLTVTGITKAKDEVAIFILNSGYSIEDDEVITNAAEACLYADQTLSDEKGVYGFKINIEEVPQNAVLNLYSASERSSLVSHYSISAADDISKYDVLNVGDFDIDSSGTEDSTVLLSALHNTGKKVFYPSGTYRFNGKTLDLSGGVELENQDVVIRNDLSDKNILQFDDRGNLIGLMQNHLEHDEEEEGTNWKMNIGSIVAPLVSTADYKTKVDFIPFWYNDFGLEYTRQNSSAWNGWYYWNWNFETNQTGSEAEKYDPDRHPLLGFYKGDDANILDWQCYWLREYGAKAVILISNHTESGITATWQSESDKNYWIYQLFNNTPNFKGLGYIMSLTPPFVTKGENHSAIESEVRAEWANTVKNIYSKFNNCYTIEKNGKKYPCIYIHEEGALLGVFDDYSGSSRTVAFLEETANRFKAMGYGGVALFVRNESSTIKSVKNTLESKDVLRFTVNYEPQVSKTATSYEEAVNSFEAAAASDAILNSFTGTFTHSPHPSGWNKPGENPQLFNKLINKQLGIIENGNMPKILTCYNVAEWAEGGPGLQPTVQNRFGYLQAMKDAIVIDEDAAKMNINVSLINEKANVVTEARPITSSKNLTAYINVSGSGQGGSFTVVKALYNGGRLVKATPYSKNMSGKSEQFEIEVSQDELKSADTLKLMLLDNMNSLTPLANCKVFSE